MVGLAALLLGKWLERRNAEKQAQLAARTEALKEENRVEEADREWYLRAVAALRLDVEKADAANRELWAREQAALARNAELVGRNRELEAQLERALSQLEQMRGQVSQQAAELAVLRRRARVEVAEIEIDPEGN